jgi:hypothetical protein
MLEAAIAVTPPQEHGRMFEIVFERLSVARPDRWLFYDPRAAGGPAFAAFRDAFASRARERYGVVGAADALLGSYGEQLIRHVRVQLVTAGGEPGVAILAGGWSAPEGNGVWSDGTEAVLRLPLAGSGPWMCSLYASPYPADVHGRSLVVRVGGRVAAEWACAAGTADFGGPLDFRIDEPGHLVLEMPWATSPRELGHSDDDRRLGICLHRIALERIADAPRPVEDSHA